MSDGKTYSAISLQPMICIGALLADQCVFTGNVTLNDGDELNDRSSCANYGLYIIGKWAGSDEHISTRSAIYGSGYEPYKTQDYAVFAVVELLDSVKFVGGEENGEWNFANDN